MVHKLKREYVVTAIGGTKWSPEVMGYWVRKTELADKIEELKKNPYVRRIDVQEGDFVDYMRGFTPMGEVSIVRQIRSLKPTDKVQIAVMKRPKGLFEVPKVLKVI